jgi:hypothetical protein
VRRFNKSKHFKNETKFNGFLVLLISTNGATNFCAERAVSGTVSDNTGMPLPGVSVLVKGTKSGTQTDLTENMN